MFVPYEEWTTLNNGQETKDSTTKRIQQKTQGFRSQRTNKQLDIFYKTDFLPLLFSKWEKEKRKKSRAAYIPFLSFDFSPSIYTNNHNHHHHNNNIKKKKKKGHPLLISFSFSSIANNNSLHFAINRKKKKKVLEFCFLFI